MADTFVKVLVSLDHSCFNILSSNLLFHNENKYTSPLHFSNGTLKFMPQRFQPSRDIPFAPLCLQIPGFTRMNCFPHSTLLFYSLVLAELYSGVYSISLHL